MRGKIGVLGLVLLFSVPAWAGDDVESTYKTYCVSCHGTKGDGDGHAQMKVKPTAFRSPTVQNSTDEELYKAIGYGVGHKEYAHGFAERGLSTKQIVDLVAYVRKLSGPSKKNK